MNFATQFLKDARVMAGDLRHRKIIRTALGNYELARDKGKASFQSWESARQLAAETKWDALNHLDKYLVEFVAKIEARGTKVHWASTAVQARDIILGIVRDKQARSIIKSKAMTAEEIHLNDALEKAGLEVVESDLGEFIVQLRHEAPYHIVFPSMHLTRGEIKELFQRELGDAPSDNPEELTMVARRALRKKYLTADIGITGANFAIAETGMISITENEGNARLTAALPKTMISLLGIEKILPKLGDLALFLPMLATAGTGQPLTCYNTMYGGPRQPGESDGPEEWHVVLLDNHRTELLADAGQRDALHCIRCGACLNVCPIFKNIGGHAYGTTYSGPIGSVITPHLRGLQDWKHLSNASSLCGACTEACPVKIDLHHHLLQNRRNAVVQQSVFKERIGFKAFVELANHPKLWAFAKKFARLIQPLQKLMKGTRLDPGYHWTQTRDLPDVAPETFKDWWEETEMTEREHILARVREALKTPAPLPGAHGETLLPDSAKTISTARQWLPKVGSSSEEQFALFARNAAELKADFQLFASRYELKTALAKICAAENWKRIASHHGELTDSIVDALGLPICFTDKNYDVHELETCDAGISECDALIAQTGTVLVTNRSAGGRALSVLPPHHVVLARREQLVADLPAAFELLQQKYAANYPSMISFITGPSRTGDIERILVLGAHGPKKLTIFCL